MYNSSNERHAWWHMDSTLKDSYTFDRAEGLFLNFDVIFLTMIRWPLMGFVIYTCIFYYDVYMKIFPDVFIILLIILTCLGLVLSCVDLRHRWLLFKYSEKVALFIDTKQRVFMYKHSDNVIRFNSDDIDTWYWERYSFWACLPLTNTCAEIVEIRLKNGETIIVSNGIGHVLYFFLENWKELGLPEGQNSSKSLSSYVKEILTNKHLEG